MTANGAACPSCRMDAVMCIGKEMRTGGPCCADCRMQFVQRPMHVWATATVSADPTETTEEGQ
jgi:transposase-like protein